MSNVPVARRYARALLGAAAQQTDEVLSQIDALLHFLGENPQSFSALSSPALSRAQRMKMVEGILAGTTGMHPALGNLLKLLTDRNRFSALPIIARQYRDMVDTEQGRLRGRVSSAKELSQTQLDGIRSSLEQLTSRKVLIDQSIDPSLLGGVVAHVGSRVYDGSLKNQLREIARTLERPIR